VAAGTNSASKSQGHPSDDVDNTTTLADVIS